MPVSDTDALKNRIENLRSPTTGRWVSVKDRVPGGQYPVIVYVPPNEDHTGYVGTAYYTYSANGGFWAGTDGQLYGAIGIIHNPTHWMPLPRPPKEDKNETD